MERINIYFISLKLVSMSLLWKWNRFTNDLQSNHSKHPFFFDKLKKLKKITINCIFLVLWYSLVPFSKTGAPFIYTSHFFFFFFSFFLFFFFFFLLFLHPFVFSPWTQQGVAKLPFFLHFYSTSNSGAYFLLFGPKQTECWHCSTCISLSTLRAGNMGGKTDGPSPTTLVVSPKERTPWTNSKDPYKNMTWMQEKKQKNKIHRAERYWYGICSVAGWANHILVIYWKD